MSSLLFKKIVIASWNVVTWFWINWMRVIYNFDESIKFMKVSKLKITRIQLIQNQVTTFQLAINISLNNNEGTLYSAIYIFETLMSIMTHRWSHLPSRLIKFEFSFSLISPEDDLSSGRNCWHFNFH